MTMCGYTTTSRSGSTGSAAGTLLSVSGVSSVLTLGSYASLIRKYRKRRAAASGEGTEFAAAFADSRTIQGCAHGHKEEGRRSGALLRSWSGARFAQ
jgi:hypothetical protein